MKSWINKDTEIYCSFAQTAGNTGCQMMNTAFYYYGLNKIYKSFSVENIESAVEAVKTLDIKGFAVTMPYKVEVLNYVDEMEDSVKEIGAANTVVNSDGKLRAYNTDAFSASTFLRNHDNEKVLYIIGNGGYAKAVKWAAANRGFNIEQITRNTWNYIEGVQSSIVYNCTPVNVHDLVNASNVFIDCLVESNTGKKLAALQASKQFKLYTNLEWPL